MQFEGITNSIYSRVMQSSITMRLQTRNRPHVSQLKRDFVRVSFFTDDAMLTLPHLNRTTVCAEKLPRFFFLQRQSGSKKPFLIRAKVIVEKYSQLLVRSKAQLMWSSHIFLVFETNSFFCVQHTNLAMMFLLVVEVASRMQ